MTSLPELPSHQGLSGVGDWAERFFTRGWRGRPWVVLERAARTARRFDQALREARALDGWAFGLCSYRILDAPTFDIHTDTATRLRIIGAIRESPACRAAEFEQFWRPHWEARGLPPALIKQITPRPDEPLTERSFNWPVLLVAIEPDTRKLVLLGSVASMDILLHALVARHEVDIDEALALLVLLTCHGKPADVKYETQADGTVVPRLTFSDSAFTQPLHLKRFKQILPALCNRSIADDFASAVAKRAERLQIVLQLLVQHIPSVIADLRRNPPPAGHTIHSVARSRLAESLSDELLGRMRRARRNHGGAPWWNRLDELSLQERRKFLRLLSPGQHEAVQAARKGKRTRGNANTRRVHLHRAYCKFRSMLRETLV